MKHIIFRSTRSGVPKKLALLLLLFVTCLPAWAADYVIKSGNYYIGMNAAGTALEVKSTFDESCLWTTTNALSTTSQSVQNKKFPTKYLTTSCERSGGFVGGYTYEWSAITVGTSTAIWRGSDDGDFYARHATGGLGGWNRQASISINTAGTSITMSDNNTSNSSAYLVTTTEIPALTYIEGIEGIDAIGLTGIYNYTRIGSAIATTPACTKYTFNSTNYYKLSDNTITTTNPNPVSEEFTYTWSATCNDNSYTYSFSNGVLTITSVPTTDKTITITLQATKTGQETQTVTKTVNVSNRPPTGTVGGTVYLNDYEDHTWTYYAGVPSDVDGGNYDTNYAGKMYSPDPRNVKITYQANGGAVSISESETEFVYYKTIEKVNNAYKYQVISNPFSKRPSTGSGSSKVYKGFGGWKIISGGDYIQGKNNNDVLTLDEELTLTGLDNNYTANCTSAEIVLQATWVNATVVRNTTSGLSNSGTYETNIIVLSQNYSTAISPSYPCTIMMVEPDGSADYRTYTFIGSITPPSGGIAKIEFAKWNPNGNIAMGGRNLWIGRGVTCTGDTRSVTLAGNSVSNQIVKIESGKFSTLTHYSGAPNTNSTTPLQRLTLGNDYDRAKKDWETSTPTLEFTGKFLLANGENVVSNNDAGANTYMAKVLSKSGKFMTSVDVSQAANGNCYYVSVYGTSGRTGKRYLEIEGGEWVSIAGGRDNDMNGTKNTADYINFSLRMRGGHVKGSIYGGAEQYSVQGSRQIVITGGEINGWVAGGANGTSTNNGATTGMSYVYVGGNARVDSKGSTTSIGASLGGNIYAAGCGYNTTSSSGEVTLGTNVVFADEAYVERGVYGGGAFGFCSNNKIANVYITGGIVNGASGTYQTRGNSPTTTPNVIGGVFGGARQNKGGYANVYMTGGLVKSGLFGGSNNSGTLSNDVNIVVTGGQVGTTSATANIHGGGYGQNTGVSGNVNVTLGTRNTTTGVTSGTAVVYGDVYGGSALGSVNGTTAADTYKTNVTLNAGTINGSLYGGALGNSTTAANVYGPVAVKVYGGSVKKTDENGANGSGAVYGANNINGAPQRAVTVDIYGTDAAPASGGYALFSVYGGGNKADYTYGNGYPKVTVHNCDNSVEYVYGGGNAAAVASTDVTIYGGNKIGNVFGGGNGQVTAANVNGNTSVKIYGGTIGDVYGGSNTNGTIGGTISVTVNSQAETSGDDSCPMAIDNVYGGGNKAASQSGTVNIGCTGTYVAASGSTPESGYIRNVYGGANQANIGTSSNPSNISLTIKAGHIDNVFGGNNNSGTINGTITVTVKEDLTNYSCGMLVGNVYGGGNLASYGSGSDYPVVKIEKGHLTGSVFGGGKGSATDATHATGAVTGNPQVTIGSTTSTDVVTIDGNVFGGGDAANVAGSPVVLVQNCNTKIGTTSTTGGVTTYTNGSVYGGGNAAHVTGSSNSTSVTINGGTINRVFGGGNGEVSAANVAGNATTTIHGGTIHQAFAGSNAAGTISGTAKITVDKTGSCDEKIDEVYGGGNIAAGNAGTVDIKCGAIIGDVYGGANQANVTSDITLNITGGTIDNVFGGNNTSGNITGKITVNINKADDCSSFSVGTVYGAGNQAAYTPTTPDAYPAVNIKNGTVSQNVYGGGLGSTATVTSNPVVTLMGGTVTGHIFGGGDAAPVTGNPTVVANYGSTTNIYAGGKGSTAIVTGSPTATINLTSGKTLSVADVFGGGDAAAVQAPTSGTSICTVNMQAGSVSHIYGGGNQAGVSTTDVNVSGGAITGGLYGGCNTSGTVTGAIAVDVTGGTIGTLSTPANVHGGGYGSATATGGNVAVTINGSSATIYGDVYGGSALGNVNDASTETTTVTLTSGTINGNLYGGGLGNTTYAAGVAGKTVVSVTGGTVNNVFGCNNVNGAPVGGATVTVNGGTINNNVYGGGNLAAASVSPVVTINNGTLPGSVFGGGLGASAVVTGDPKVVIGDDYSTHSVSIAGNVFGGGDAANVKGATTVTVNNCNTLIGAKNTSDEWSTTAGTVYGGGNAADVVKNGTTGGSTSVIINGGDIYRVFGGGNGEGTGNPGANVANGTNVEIHAGNIHQAFAGSNAKGNITGTSLVTIDHDVSTCDELIDEVYGGGNLAAGNAGAVTVECGAVIGDLYGGANQADIGTSTDPCAITLNVTGGTINRVFGGNNTSGNVTGKITVNINKGTSCDLDLNYVYGAGNQAAYTPTTESAYPEVNILNGTVAHDVFGGGLGASATVTSNPVVNINGGDVAGDVYGGGSLASVTGNTTVNLKNANSTVTGNIYGGGLGCNDCGADNGPVAANVSGTTAVTISNGEVTNVFGCNNINGAPATGATVTVNGGDISNNVYGGGNLAAATVSPVVTINNGILPGSVFGGGYGSTAIITGNPQVTIGNNNGEQQVTISGNVFGGGDAANVVGVPHVTVNDCGTIIGTKTTGTSNEKDGTVYGGCNAAHVIGSTSEGNNGTSVSITGGQIYRVFAGGNGVVSPANIAGNPTLTVSGGEIAEIYGGSNSQGSIGGVPKITIAKVQNATCPLVLENLYGGGNEAPSTGVNLVVEGCDSITNVYGGANKADISGDVTLTIKSGHIGNVFGGNNNSGKIMGNIVVNIDRDGECWNVNNVYGCGNLAVYSVYGYNTDGTPITSGTEAVYADPQVNIINGKVNNNVFGAGKGDGTKVTGSTDVYKGHLFGNTKVTLTGGSCKNVYGGGDAAPVNGNTNVTINATARPANEGEYHVEECVFGGGLGATAVIHGDTKITVTGNSAIHGNVYGGGNAGLVTGDTHIDIK